MCSSTGSGGDGRRANRFLLELASVLQHASSPSFCKGRPTPYSRSCRRGGWQKLAIVQPLRHELVCSGTRDATAEQELAPPAGAERREEEQSARDAHHVKKNEAFPHAPRAAVGEHGVAAARRRQQQQVRRWKK